MGKYFTIDELCKSDTAKKKGIDNTPTAEIKQKLEVLIDELLDPVREAWGKPIRVNSGYRCPKLNKAVGGVSNSQHIKGEAADLNAGSVSLNKQLFELIRTRYEYDQLIDEANYAWVHVSYVRKIDIKCYT
jgi:Peptidase M15.